MVRLALAGRWQELTIPWLLPAPPMRAAASWLSALAGRTTFVPAAFQTSPSSDRKNSTPIPFPGHLRHIEGQHAKGRGGLVIVVEHENNF